MMIVIYIAVGYLAVTSVILLRNRFHFTPLRETGNLRFDGDAPRVSICVPARNEERNIRRCVESLLQQRYPNLEILVLNDNSTDRTGEILNNIRNTHPESGKLTVLEGRPKPDDWLGKPWACHQLSKHAGGDILIFADADTWFSRHLVERVVRSLGHDVVDMLTVWPKQVLGSFWEKMIIPLVYYALLSLLPVQYVYRNPRWMPGFLAKRFSPLFAAACGQFMAFKKRAYNEIGGHRSVRGKIVEDVELAGHIKRAGFRMRMYYGSQAVSCRMYRSGKEIHHGFRKNFFAGFGYNVSLFVMMAIVQLLVYITPFFLVAWGIFAGNPLLALYSAIPVILVIAHRVLVARWFGWNPLWSLLHPLSVCWFQWLAFVTLKDYLSSNSVNWKGRPV
ncbi:MAG: glycosyltransferase family 2 protein [Balneolaceae bacterium]|nr:glycosyltransferase family 2 protein [Balneolaceae bacterium]